MRTEERVNTFKDDLMKEDWGSVYNTSNINEAYENLLQTYLLLYDKKLPDKNIGG